MQTIIILRPSCSFQSTFAIDDILFFSEIIYEEAAKSRKLITKSRNSNRSFWAQKLGEVPPKTFNRFRAIKSTIKVSLAVSNLVGKRSLVFVQPGTKVDSSYYCENVLKQGLLPDIRSMSGGDFTFQHNGALFVKKLLTFYILMYPPSLNLTRKPSCR